MATQPKPYSGLGFLGHSDDEEDTDSKEESVPENEKKTKKETSEENISEEDSKNWESYNIFKISDKEKIKDLFYSFIKGCILTSTAILRNSKFIKKFKRV